MDRIQFDSRFPGWDEDHDETGATLRSVALWIATAVGMAILTICSCSAAYGGDASTFRWAANAPCECKGNAFTFALASKHGCPCGEGCPCCSLKDGCKCRGGSQCLDERFNLLREQCIKERKTLIVSVGCEERKVEGAMSCRLNAYPGVKEPKVLVCKVVNGTFSRVAELTAPTDSDLLRAVQPAAPLNCPNGNCPVFLPLLLGALTFEEADVKAEPKPAVRSVSADSYMVSAESAEFVAVRRAVAPLRRLLALPFRAIRAVRSRSTVVEVRPVEAVTVMQKVTEFRPVTVERPVTVLVPR